MFRRKPPPSPPSPPSGAPGAPGPSLRDRFDRTGRQVMMASVAQAQADGSATTDEHHLLLAVVAAPSPTAWTLATQGLDEARLRDALDRCGGPPHPPSDQRTPLEPAPGVARAPYSDGAIRMLQVAMEVARRRGRETVGAADIALAVLGTTSPPVVDALADLGLDPEALRADLHRPA